MFLDKEGEFSDAQAITVTAPSTNHIDTNNTVNRAGEPLKVYARVPTAFTAGGAATLVIAIREDNDAAMASPVVIAQTAAIPVADLVAGAEIEMPQLPSKTLRYLDINYTVATGPMLTGNIDAGLVVDEQTSGASSIAEQDALVSI